MKITLPEGYTMPDSAKPGEPFEAVATLVAADDGTFDLTAIDGQELGSGEEMEMEMEMEMEEPEEQSPEQRLATSVKMPWNDEEEMD